jgi:hypothetical protein
MHAGCVLVDERQASVNVRGQMTRVHSCVVVFLKCPTHMHAPVDASIFVPPTHPPTVARPDADALVFYDVYSSVCFGVGMGAF